MNTKVCTRCKQSKPVSEFGPRSDAPDGLRSNCNECRRTHERLAAGALRTKQKTEDILFAKGKKQCIKCEKILAISEFGKDNSSRHGLRATCKMCRNPFGKTRKQERNSLEVMGKKRCTKCNEVRSISEFKKHRRTLDGLNSQCLYCTRKPNGRLAKLKERAELAVMGKKRCSMCGKIRGIEYFSKCSATSDGLRSQCRLCLLRYDYTDTKRRYFESDQGKRKQRVYNLVSRLKYPEKYGARNAVTVAVRTGNLAPVTSLPCEDCGKIAKEYHHHKGYDPEHWLDVVPLCVRCHRKRENGITDLLLPTERT